MPALRPRCLAAAFAVAVLAVAAQAVLAEEVFTGEDVSKRSFARKALEGALFDATIALEADFTEARLARATFRGAQLGETRFDRADLTGADFREATMRWTSFTDADASQANFEGADLSKAHLRRTILRGANLRNLAAIATAEGLDLRGADVRGANLMGFEEGGAVPAKWRGAKYDRATKWPKGFDPVAAEAILYKGDVPAKPVDTGDRPGRAVPPGRDFRGQDLSKRTFVDQDLADASLWNVDAKDARFERIRLVGADLSGADLSAAVLLRCDLTRAELRRLKPRWATFEHCDLSGADLRGSDLAQCHLLHPNFRGADLRDLQGIGVVKCGVFDGADLRGANLGAFRDDGTPPKTSFRGARYDKWTRWPAGFDPAAEGAVLDAGTTPPAGPGGVERGKGLMGEGLFDEAAAAFREAVRADPRDKAAWTGLANALRALGRPDAAARAKAMADAAPATRDGAAPMLTPAQEAALDGNVAAKDPTPQPAEIGVEGSWTMDVPKLRGYIEDVIRRKRPNVTPEQLAASVDVDQGWFTAGTTRLELRPDGAFEKSYDLPAMAGRESLTVRERGTWTREGTTVLLRVSSTGSGLAGGALGATRVDRLELVETWLVLGGTRGIWWKRAP
ncbi:MAG: pentapeptide repeat-containing protein [Planctomycetia bacterium]|nr:pentapeptide repeat-containing protein [Planctomycetia bacterium]